MSLLPFIKTLIFLSLIWPKTTTLGAFKLAAAQDGGKAASVVSLMQAKAFVLRIIKCDRPVVSADWRMWIRTLKVDTQK